MRLKLAHYELLDKVGEGGMGEVYRARDSRLDRTVAVKVIRAQSGADQNRIRRFEREARAAASLNHPHIVAVFDTGQADSVHYIAMEYVDGAPLAAWIERERPELRRIVEVFIQVADALAAAHAAGIVHRDMKPANVLVTRQGYAKVLDFGLAKLTEQDPDSSEAVTLETSMTRPGMVLGTVPYMSPEQAQGRALDARTDVFSLGAMLYEATAGRRAFAGVDAISILNAIVHSGARPLREVLPAAPPELDWIAGKALARELDERYQSMAEFAADLRRLKRQIDAPPLPSAAASAARPRPWIWAVAGAGLALALVASLVWIPAVRSRVLPAPGPSGFEGTWTQLTSYSGTESSGALSPDGRHFAFVSEKSGVPDIWVRQVSGGEPHQITHDAAVETDLVYAPDGESLFYATLGNGAAIWQISSLGGTPRRIIDRARSPTLGPGAKQLALLRGDRLEVAGIDGANPRTIYEHGGVATGDISWSPDGQWIAFSEGYLFGARNVSIIDPRGASKRAVTRLRQGAISSQAWLPDSRRLVVSQSYDPSTPGTSAADLIVVDIEGGPPRRITTTLNARFNGPSISADGRRILATLLSHEREVWQVPFGPDPAANGAAATRVVERAWDPVYLGLSGDGKTLLFNSSATGSRSLWTRRLEPDAQPRQIPSIPGNVAGHAALSRDGSRVAYVSNQAGNVDVWVMNSDGSNPLQLTHDDAKEIWPSWSHDDRWIAFTSPRGSAQEIWKVPSSGGELIQMTRSNEYHRGAWSPIDSRYASFSGGRVEVVDGENGNVLLRVAAETGNVLPVWSPDGRWLSILQRDSNAADAIWVIDTSTGERRVAARFPGRFHIRFRIPWASDGRSFLVNRIETVNHIVLLDDFR